jgi:hypothetical protein
LLDRLARHSRAIAIASLPFVLVLLALASVLSPWYYAAVGLLLIAIVALAARLERLEPGAFTPKKTRLADMPSSIGRNVAVLVYAIGGAFALAWAIFELRHL